MNRLLRHIWPLFVIFIIWFTFSIPFFLQGQVPFPSKYMVTFFPPWNASYAMPVKNNAMPDVITQIYPWKHFTIESWEKGIIPLWNPYSFSGTPHAANYQSAVFSPMNILFFLMPFVEAWSWMILLQPLLAAFFIYLFLRSIFLSRTASLLGSLSFMFCGFIVVWMAYGTLGYAILPLPLLLFGVRKYIETKRVRFGILISFALAFSLLSGHLQISMYLVGFSILFACFEVWSLKTWRLSLMVLLFFLLGAGLAMLQILPSFEAFNQSVRSTSFGSAEAIPWLYLVTSIAPDFYGNPVTRNDWYGHYAEWASYLGAIPLLFTFYGLFKKKQQLELFFWILALVTLLLATSSPINWLLYALKVPVLATSAASRVIVLTSFSFAVLSALGFEYVQKDWDTNNKKYILKYSIIIGLLIGSIWVAILLRPLSDEKLGIAMRNFVLPTILILISLTNMIIGTFSKRFRSARAALLTLLVAFEAIRFASKWMPFEPRQFLYPSNKIISYLQEISRESRVFGNFGNEVATYFEIPVIEGYDAVYHARYGEFIASAERGIIQIPERSVVSIDKHGVFTERLLQLIGVKYLLHRKSDGRNIWAYPVWDFPQYISIYRDEHHEIFENTKVLPRVFLASSYILGTQKKDIIHSILDESIDLRDTVVLEQKPFLEPEKGVGEANIHDYLPNKVVIKVKSEVSKLLFLSDVYDEGWKAYVDGKETQLYRADYTFRALSVPRGEHTVYFFYWPASFRNGLIISSISFGILVLLILKHVYENRNL